MKSKPGDVEEPRDKGLQSTVLLTSYEYLGDFSATPPWHSRAMSCDDCRVSWTGCWDNFQCPKCGMGDLPGFGGEPMTLSELKAMHEESLLANKLL
jgi:hypothetical protein